MVQGMKAAQLSMMWFVCFVALARSTAYHKEQWHSWKELHGKVYMDISEEKLRRSIWFKNVARIEKFNNDIASNFSLAINQFADLTFAEYKKNFLSPLATTEDGNYTGVKIHYPTQFGDTPIDYPDRVDWRQKGFVTPVKNQGSHCKQSSWAFSATAAIEGQYYRENGNLVSLSEQQLIDCSSAFGNAGCHGGHMVNSFKYVMKHGGICKESDYDYLGYKWHCMSEYCTSVAQCLDYTLIKIGSEIALLDAVYRNGPVSVGVDASNYHFQFYSDGVYAERGCNSHSLNHGMLLVGYGVTYDGVEYWIVKNSWGTTWGDSGYMKIARNRNNMCGIATAASYPNVKQAD